MNLIVPITNIQDYSGFQEGMGGERERPHSGLLELNRGLHERPS